jgi:carbon monoxide dehydrogenase subunit G
VKLEHSFTVPVGIDDAWKILLDIERVAPCMPGATLESVEGDEFTGKVRVKLGAINLTYKGKATFVEKDEAAHRAVLDARGRDARGNGTASARVTTSMSEENGSTTVLVNTDLDITGKVAQFGRGVMVDVGNKLIGQFADCLAQQITLGNQPAAAPAAGSTPAKKSTARKTTRTRTAKAAAGAGGPSDGGPSAAATAAAHATAAVGAGGGEPTEEAAAPLEPAQSVEEAARPAEEAAQALEHATSAEEAVEPLEPAPSANGRSAAVATEPEPEVEPINLLEHAGPAIAKRAAPPLVGLLLVLLYVVLRRRGAR